MTGPIAPIWTPPTPEEIRGRLDRVQSRMREEGLDAYVAASPDNVLYLTNFANFVHERPFLLVVPAEGTPTFLVPRLEIPHVEARAVGALELASYPEFPAPAGRTWRDVLSGLLPSGGRTGVESTCPLMVHEAVSGERVRTDIIDDVRMVKTPYEIGRIAYACGLLSAAQAGLLETARPGTTLAEVSPRLTGTMLMRVLADQPRTNMLATRLTAAFQPPSVSHDPHNFTDVHVAMEEGGPHVSVFNCVINGYAAEIERTFFVGGVPEAAVRPFAAMMEARDVALEATVAGAVMGDVDRKVNACFARAGYGDALLHRTGHGMGVTGHEAPFLADGYERIIEPGMVFTIEPGIYLPGIGGFRHSDTVLVTESGNRMLTSGPTDLASLTVG